MSLPTPSVIIQGIGSFAPENVVTNQDLEQQMDTSDEWIRTRTGIRERRIAPADVHTSDMAVEAGKRAIDNAGLQPGDIDLLIVATMSPDLPFPSTACLVQAKLGLRTIPSFDITAACSGFIYLQEIGANMVRSGPYKHALIIGAEKMSAIVDWEDRGTCVLFGDGAGACVLSKSQQLHVGILQNILGGDGSNPNLLFMPGGGTVQRPTTESIVNRAHYLKMNGKEIFKHAVRVMGQATLDVMQQNGVQSKDIALVVPHQANIRIIDAIAARLDVPKEKFLINVDRFGNTSAASIPIALDEAYRNRRFTEGDYILCVAFGAGLTWGASLIKWTKTASRGQ